MMEYMGGQQVIEHYQPTYIMAPSEDSRFYPSQARALADRIMRDELDGQEYDEEDAMGWSLSLCDKVRSQIIDKLRIPRYKIVVQVTIGQMRDQDVRIASRCLWDTMNDNYASVSYKSRTIWASVLIFALYTE